MKILILIIKKDQYVQGNPSLERISSYPTSYSSENKLLPTGYIKTSALTKKKPEFSEKQLYTRTYNDGSSSSIKNKEVKQKERFSDKKKYKLGKMVQSAKLEKKNEKNIDTQSIYFWVKGLQ